MHPSRRVVPSVVAALGLLLSAHTLFAQRTLHWRELAVEARLEADGTLAVREDHAMVFSGAWNGGERVFRLPFGQQLTLDSVSRRDPATGAWTPLERGSLDVVGHWDWKNGRTLRWRSRSPKDPEFAATEIDTRIEYRLTGVLRRDGDAWVLDHDFAFPQRDGEIARFRLDLDLAPQWQAADELPRHLDEGPLPPGRSRVVTARLRYVGEGTPARAAAPRLAPGTAAAIVLGALISVIVLLLWAFRRDRALGRLQPLPPLDAVDRGFLDARVFTLSPEEAGAAWDDTVGSAEVAAMLARMQLEGKLASRVEEKGLLRQPNLHLTLRVPRSALSGAESQLVSELFPNGDETDTESLRRHYRSTGFDPAKKLEPRLRDTLRARGGFSAPRPHPPRWPSAVLIAAGAAGIVLAALLAPALAPAPVALGLVVSVAWIPAFLTAFWFRRRVAEWQGLLVVIVLAELAALVALAVLSGLPGQSVIGTIGGALLCVGLARTVATAMQSRQGAETVARRRELAAARAWFEAELVKPAPRLEDSWAPYLIAFGLAPRMDRWWKSFGGAHASPAPTTWSGGSGGSAASPSTGGGWTGGGGSFGGAGATASWAMAATSMSAGVAAASSGSGGGGGGGSSGGGGGGGW